MKMKLVFSFWIALVATAAMADVFELAKSSGIKGGLIVHLGCGDGQETATLQLDERYLVQGLDVDTARVAQARKNLQEKGLYGKISVRTFDGVSLPYTDNLINLLIDSSTKSRVPMKERMRVLVPGGVAIVDGKKIVKPWPEEIDEWTHFLHGADNNAVASDRKVDIPRSIQWVSNPRWGRSHEELASMSAAVTTQGRLFYIVDEAKLASIRYLSNWKLVARDAFNGTLLWKKPIPVWNDHLRHFRSGPVHLPRRLVAVGDRVYTTLGLAGPVTAIDAASGEIVQTFKGTERTEEILFAGGVLYLVVGTSEPNRRGGGLFDRGEPKPSAFRFVTAVDAESGKMLWKKDFSEREFLLPLTLAVRGKNVFYQSTSGMVCLDAQTGTERWNSPRPTPERRMAFSTPTLVATEDVVLCADQDASDKDNLSSGKIEWGVHGWNEPGFQRRASCTLRAYDVTDGRELWSVGCSEGYNSPVDIFVIDETVWVGTAFTGYDLKTGKVKKEINTKGPRVGMAHHRCYRNKATERMILTGRSGVEVIDLEKGWLSNNSWVRGTCQYGIMPANGLIYAPPDACACFLTVKVPGFFAAAPQRGKTGHMPFPEKPVLETGPLYGKTIKSEHTSANDWPTYRHDAARSGAGASIRADAISDRWSVLIGGRLTQPVIAGGKAYVASIDTHTIHALSIEDNGRETWRFTADARIDSPPTLYQGRVLFGSADGWVYCLAAADGQLVWRFRAAPEERLVNVYGQLESVWAVHGSVLVQNDTLYVSAGRTTYTDGGIVMYRLDPISGKQLSRSMLYHLDPETGRQLTLEARFNMKGTTSDILSGDGEHVFLKEFCFDRLGKPMETSTPHLWSITTFLGEEWFVRSYWIFGETADAGWGGWANAANRYPSGRILCFDTAAFYGYGRQNLSGGPVGHRADTHRLFRTNRNVDAKPIVTTDKRGKKKAAPKKPAPVWTDMESLTVRAMTLAGDRLVVIGPPDLGKKSPKLLAFENESETLAAFEGQKGVLLRVISAANGKKIAERKIPSMPVFDGLSTAGGRLFISTTDGKVLCLGSDQD